MSNYMPPKPILAKGIKIYTVIALCFWLLMMCVGFSAGDTTIDYNYDGIVDYKDKFIRAGDDVEEEMTFLFVGLPLVIFCPTLGFGLRYFIQLYDYKLAQNNYPKYLKRLEKRQSIERERQLEKEDEIRIERNIIERERQEAIQSQEADAPWTVRYSTSPCPHCGHYKVRYAKWEDKSISVAFWGVASSKLGTNYKCEHCKRMWE